MSILETLRRPLALRACFVAAASLVLLTTVFVNAAHAHGSAIDPSSRNYGCWKRWGSDFQNPAMATQDPMCWFAWSGDTQAMWNWNGLYREGVAGNHQGAIPDGTLCSGGNTFAGRYDRMDEPGNWQATNVGTTFTWRMHDQALHGADYIRVYVTRQGYNPLTTRLRWSDLELRADTGRILPGVGTRETDPVLNGVTISVPVTAPGRSGRHIVYAIWQASHSDQSYYFCSDVNFGGTTQPTTTPPVTTTTRPPTTTTTSRPPTTTTSGPPTTGACSATYTITNQWPGGFQGEVRVTAGSAAITGWTVNWTFAGGQTVTQSWNTALTPSGSAMSARNVAWNGSLAAGASTTFGFLGSWNGTNPVPALTCAAT
jgi:lytic cellulose monooxygenase (C4-dehydrogenating)